MQIRLLKKTQILIATSLVAGLFGMGCGESTSKNCDEVANPCQEEGDVQCNSSGAGVETCGADADGCLAWETTATCGANQTCQGAACECNSGCATADETQCNDTVIQTCTADADDCLNWEDGVDCADDDMSCNDSAEPAVCSETCTDQCSADDTQCNGTVIQQCLTIGECLLWQDDTDCADTSQICSDAGGTAGCYTPCTNDCDTLDAIRCDGNWIQTCSVDDDGCNDWLGTTDCEVSGLVCSEAGGAAECVIQCTDDCDTIDATQCSADATGIETCLVGADGCNDWVVTFDCAGPGLVCWMAVCMEPCTDECDTLDATQCDGSGTIVQTCTLNETDGCNDLVDSPCADPTPLCEVIDDDAQCVCADECDTLDATQCSVDAADIETCQAGADGCNDWVATENCSGGGQVCHDSACIDPCVDECDPAGATQCDGSGTIVQTCTLNEADGCNDLIDTPCTDPTPLCEVVGGTAQCVCAHECDTVGGTCNANVPENCSVDSNGCRILETGSNCAPLACVIDGNNMAACQSGCTQIVHQPLAADNPQAVMAGALEDVYSYIDSFGADDFSLSGSTTITTIWTPGATTNSSYYDASAIHFEIYGNAGGQPNGIPHYSGTPLWQISLAPTDAQLTISGGTLVLNLNTPISLSAGTYWFALWVELNSAEGTRFHFWYMSDTTNGSDAMAIAPATGGWMSLPANGARQDDMAFGFWNCP